MNLEQNIDELWDVGFREADIAADLGISQYAVLCMRRGKPPLPDVADPSTEIRYATMFGRGGSTACRRIAVTLPYSGTMQSVA